MAREGPCVLLEGVSFPQNRAFLWSSKQDRVFSLEKKKNTYTWQWVWLVYESHRGISLLTLLHRITPKTGRRAVCVCVCACRRECTPRIMWLCLHICAMLSFFFLGSNLLPFRCSLSSFSYVAHTLKRFRLIQGTIKLSNGHNNYVKAGYIANNLNTFGFLEVKTKCQGHNISRLLSWVLFYSVSLLFK